MPLDLRGPRPASMLEQLRPPWDWDGYGRPRGNDGGGAGTTEVDVYVSSRGNAH